MLTFVKRTFKGKLQCKSSYRITVVKIIDPLTTNVPLL